MTNARPLDLAELKLANLTHEISETARLFTDADPKVGKIIRRELLRAYGDYLAEVAKALQSL